MSKRWLVTTGGLAEYASGFAEELVDLGYSILCLSNRNDESHKRSIMRVFVTQ